MFILFAIVYFATNIASHSDSTKKEKIPIPPVSADKLLAKGEIQCRNNIAIWGSNHHTQNGAIGFFIQFNKGKATLYAFDLPEENQGSERVKAKVHKFVENGETYYNFQKGSGYVQFQIEGSDVTNVIWKPDQYKQKEYMITPATINGCSVMVG